MRAFNTDAVVAIWRRQLSSLLGNPLGYVFILAFVLVSAGFLFLQDEYFARNIADFGPLFSIMPWLLVVLVPALAMGSWATERELGTEEQLLTLPISVFDALLGKWLGVVTFFTLALVCSLSNVVVLMWLGEPDVGLVLAHYVGWWCAGLVFAALGVLASTMVTIPAIGFVLGVLFCSFTVMVADGAEWFDPFNRGVVTLGGLTMSLVLSGVGLCLAALVIDSRRWQRGEGSRVAVRTVVVAGLAVTLFNLTVQADRAALDVDVTGERLSSLSEASLDVLRSVDEPITMTAFLSRDLPPELALKGKEVENLLKVMDREMGDRVRLTIHRPADPLDDAGSLATQHFGFTARRVDVDSVAGRELAEVFLGVVVRSGPRSQRIDHFSPGLSVEYELVRAIRTVATLEKKVLGIVGTDLKLTGGFDFQARQMRPDWAVVNEWRKQYDVRQVNLDVPVEGDVDVLVAPQPSGLDDESLRHLHDYIWDGRPCLILEDPLPMFAGPELGSSRPKNPPRPGQFPPPDAGGEKGDMQPLLDALGVKLQLDRIAWSDYNPSHRFRAVLPRSLVWSLRGEKFLGIPDAAATTGIDSLLLPWPGIVREAPGKSDEITVTPLVLPVIGADWGTHGYDEHFSYGLFGLQPSTPERNVPEAGERPALAVEIRGRMKRAYPFPELEDDDDLDEEELEDEAEDEDQEDGHEHGEDGHEHEEDEEEDGDEPEWTTGLDQLGELPIHVILVADTDFAHDQFFAFYRNEAETFSEDDLQFLLNLRNVQFLANAVDSLAEDAAFLELRSRRPKGRPLAVLEQVFKDTQEEVREAENNAQSDADVKIAGLRSEFQVRLSRIDQRTDMDANAKAQLKEQVRRTAQRQLDTDIEAINRETQRKVRESRIQQKRDIEAARGQVRWLALGVPAAILAVLAVGVLLNRRKGERLIVPESRRRSG